MSALMASMVLVQLVAPQSKRGAIEWAGTELFFPEAEHLHLGDLYSAMDALAAHWGAVERRLSEALREHDAVPVEFSHDTTTIVCRIRYDDAQRAEIEAERQASGAAVRAGIVNDPPIRMRGHSKAKRHDLPQVKVEAILGDNGIIVHHSAPAGNTSDQVLVGPSVDALQHLGYRQVSWSSDAGFNSTANREELRRRRRRSRLRRRARFEFVSSEGVGRTDVVEWVLSQPGRYAQHPDKPEVSFKCVVAQATEEERTTGEPGPMRLYVVRRNRHEEEFALRTLDRHLRKIEAALAEGGEKAAKLLRHPTYRRYVRRDSRTKDEKGKPAGAVILNRDAIARTRSRAGKSVIASDDTALHPLVLDDLYRNTADLELAFRTLKSAIEVGPIRHRRADRIEAHVMIGVMAHNLGAWIARKTGMTIEALRRLFANLRVQEVESDAGRYWERTDLEPAQRQAFLALGYDLPPKRFTATVLKPRVPRRRRAARAVG